MKTIELQQGAPARIAGLCRACAALLVSSCGACWASAPVASDDVSQILPPPGLYQIDTLTHIAMDGGKLGVAATTASNDGRSGDSAVRSQIGGLVSGEVVQKGKAPITHCIAPRSMIPTASQLSNFRNCTQQSTVVTGRTAVHKAMCPAGESTMTMRQLDAQTWEYVTVVSMGATPGGPDLRFLRPVLEHEAQFGATAAKREKAAKALAQLPELQANARKQQAAGEQTLADTAATTGDPEIAAASRVALARLQGKGRSGNTTVTERWTRIADSCAGAAPAAK
jgi:hypothetical protein